MRATRKSAIEKDLRAEGSLTDQKGGNAGDEWHGRRADRQHPKLFLGLSVHKRPLIAPGPIAVNINRWKRFRSLSCIGCGPGAACERRSEPACNDRLRLAAERHLRACRGSASAWQPRAGSSGDVAARACSDRVLQDRWRSSSDIRIGQLAEENAVLARSRGL